VGRRVCQARICEVSGSAGGTYHAEEVLDAAGVDGMQRGHLDSQQRVFGSERHIGGRVERELLGAVCGERGDGGVRGWAVWRAWDVGRRALLRQRGDRTMVDISGGNKAIGWRRAVDGVCFMLS
jgi:hypothetical protein